MLSLPLPRSRPVTTLVLALCSLAVTPSAHGQSHLGLWQATEVGSSAWRGMSTSQGAAFLFPADPASGAFTRTNLAVDAQGGLHAVAYRYAHGEGRPNYYAYCAPAQDCAAPASWRYVQLTADMPFAQIEVTPDGRPRVLLYNDSWYIDNLEHTLYRYASCEGGCDAGANWTVGDLWAAPNPGSLYSLDQRPRSFTLDAEGQPRFVYHHGTEWFGNDFAYTEYYAACATECTRPENWRRVRLPDYGYWDDFERSALAVGADGKPRLLTVLQASDERLWLVYTECSGTCTAPADWATPTLLWPVGTSLGRNVSWSLALDPADRPRFMARLQNGSLLYAWCDGGCAMGQNWLGYSLGFGSADVAHPSLAVDALGHPRLAYQHDVSLGYAWCDSGCESGQPTWQYLVAEPSSALDAALSVPIPPECMEGGWLGGYRNQLALDAQGHPRIGYDAEFLMRCYQTPQNPDPGNTFIETRWWGARVAYFPHPGSVSAEPQGPGTLQVSLSAPWPNPARGPVRLTLSQAEAGDVRLAVYDALGRRVAVLLEGALPSGDRDLSWDPAGLASGTYLLRLVGGGTVVTRTLTLAP
jgi:hypothetical protein